jgi:hypothetical protein
LQLYLTATKELFTIPMNPAGTVGDPSMPCSSFNIDTTTDYLKSVEIWYNTTAVYTITFATKRNVTQSYGTLKQGLTRQLWSITE